MKETTTRIEWNTYNIDDVMRYFSDDFDCEKSERILSIEYFLDAHKGKVVFKIIVERSYEHGRS